MSTAQYRRCFLLVLIAGVFFVTAWISVTTSRGGSFKPQLLLRVQHLFASKTSDIPRQITASFGQPRTNVLILSSVGRSGSSFLADLIASQGDSFYIFEPLRLENDWIVEESYSKRGLAQAFDCRIRKDIFTSRHGNNTLRVRRGAWRCTEEVYLHEDQQWATKMCQQTNLLVVKTIRTRLEWVKELMEDATLDLKVVHLVRDPRAMQLSGEKLGWNANYMTTACTSILQDFNLKAEMENKYPRQYFFLRYEDLCENLEDMTRQLLAFVNGVPASTAATSSLPQCVSQYIASHSVKEKGSMYNTYRSTKDVYQQWRRSVTQDQLTKTEKMCLEVLHALGYTVFNSVSRARNFSIPLLAKKINEL